MIHWGTCVTLIVLLRDNWRGGTTKIKYIIRIYDIYLRLRFALVYSIVTYLRINFRIVCLNEY